MSSLSQGLVYVEEVYRTEGREQTMTQTLEQREEDEKRIYRRLSYYNTLKDGWSGGCRHRWKYSKTSVVKECRLCGKTAIKGKDEHGFLRRVD